MRTSAVTIAGRLIACLAGAAFCFAPLAIGQEPDGATPALQSDSDLPPELEDPAAPAVPAGDAAPAVDPAAGSATEGAAPSPEGEGETTATAEGEAQPDLQTVRVVKPTRWTLVQNSGASGNLHQAEGEVRVDVTEPGTSYFHLVLQAMEFKITQGRRYTVTFEARAKRPRRFSYNLSMVHPPWHALGFTESVELTTQWSTYRGEFTAKKSDDQAGFLFPIGGSGAGIEVRDLALTELVRGDARAEKWRLETTRHSRARLEFPEEPPGVIRVEIDKKGRSIWNIWVATNADPLKIYKRYALRFRARADEADRAMATAVSQSYEPYRPLGFFRQISLSDEWEDYRFEFSASGNDESARVSFMLGDSSVPVELADVRLESLDTQEAEGPLPPPSRTHAWTIVAAFWALIGAILLFKRRQVRQWLADVQQGQVAAMEQRRAREESRSRRSLSRRRM